MQKPKVGIIFSQTSRFSAESVNLAEYFCGLLTETGYADVYMIGYEQGGPGEVASRRIKYIPHGQTKPKEVPAADVTFAHFSALQDCHVLLVAVNSNDTKGCCEKLCELFPKAQAKGISVFSLQRGVRNSSIVKDELENNGFTVMECVVGFAAVVDPKFGAVQATVGSPALLLERITKEALKTADGPTRLLEQMQVDCFFRKTLTPCSWGVLVYENLYVLNILSKGTLMHTLSKREWRLILALMIRESYKILDKAARGGKWKPDLLLINANVTPWRLELLLVLPDLLFWPACWALGLLPPAALMSPGQLDLAQGRKSMLDWHFAEMVMAGDRHRYEAPVCCTVLRHLRAVEKSLFPDLAPAIDGDAGVEDPVWEGVFAAAGAQSYNSADQMALLVRTLQQGLEDDDGAKLGKGAGGDRSLLRNHPSVGELWFWVSRVLAAISSLLLVAFLFLHDY